MALTLGQGHSNEISSMSIIMPSLMPLVFVVPPKTVMLKFTTDSFNDLDLQSRSFRKVGLIAVYHHASFGASTVCCFGENAKVKVSKKKRLHDLDLD